MSFSLDSSVPARDFDAMLKNASKHRNRNNTFIVFSFLYCWRMSFTALLVVKEELLLCSNGTRMISEPCTDTFNKEITIAFLLSIAHQGPVYIYWQGYLAIFTDTFIAY